MRREYNKVHLASSLPRCLISCHAAVRTDLCDKEEVKVQLSHLLQKPVAYLLHFIIYLTTVRNH